MARMTPEEGRAYLERWALVRDAELAELRRTPLATKLLQLAALMASGGVLGRQPERDQEILEVRERWQQLRRALGG